MTLVPSRRDRSNDRFVRPAWPWWLATAIYFTVSCLMHLQFSLWLVRPRESPWGRYALSDFVPEAAALGALLLVVVVAWQLRRSPSPRKLAGLWLMLATAAWAIDRWLTYSANEYFHYPQYALLAWLIARLLDPRRERWVPGRVLFWTILLGAIDELLQYVWITTSYSHYVDFNDVLVNLVAGAAGVLLYYGAAQTPAAATVRPWLAGPEPKAGMILMLLVATVLASGRLQLSPANEVGPGGFAQDLDGRRALFLQRSAGLHGSWQAGPHRGRHYVLGPLEAVLLVAMTSVAFTGASRRLAVPVAGGTSGPFVHRGGRLH